MMLYLDSILYFSEYCHKHRSLPYFYCLSEAVIAVSHPYFIDNLIFLQSYTILNQKSIKETNMSKHLLHIWKPASPIGESYKYYPWALVFLLTFRNKNLQSSPTVYCGGRKLVCILNNCYVPDSFLACLSLQYCKGGGVNCIVRMSSFVPRQAQSASVF